MEDRHVYDREWYDRLLAHGHTEAEARRIITAYNKSVLSNKIEGYDPYNSLDSFKKRTDTVDYFDWKGRHD